MFDPARRRTSCGEVFAASENEKPRTMSGPVVTTYLVGPYRRNQRQSVHLPRKELVKRSRVSGLRRRSCYDFSHGEEQVHERAWEVRSPI